MTTLDAIDGGAPDALIGRVIADNFRVDRLIGSGAMGNVYRAEQLSLGKMVAIKVLQPQLTSDPQIVQRFKREAKSASRLDHPNSIQIIDTGQDEDGTLYIAMELLDGRDLAQVIRQEFPLPLSRVVRIMGQVLSALDEAHVKGVVHRDLKPSNIMLVSRRGERDFVKVCDFGIAKATLDEPTRDASMLTIQGGVCGTPEYMAPEQARGEPLDGRADLYAAAVILYQMLTGEIPFQAPTPLAVVSLHLTETPVAPRRRRPSLDVSDALEALVMRALSKRREERPQTAAAFRMELEEASGLRFSGAGQIAEGGSREHTPSPRPSGPAAGAGVARTLPGMLRLTPAASQDRVSGTGPRATSNANDAHEEEPSVRPRSGRFVAVGALAGALAVAGAFVWMRSQPQTATPVPAERPAPMQLPAKPEPAAAAPAPAPEPPPTAAEPQVTTPEPEAALAKAEPVVKQEPKPEPDRPHRKRAANARPTRAERGQVIAASVPAPAPPPIAAAPAAAPVALPPPAEPRPVPAAPISEAERLLSQGEVAEACRRGEEAKRANPALASTHKFLGKCYMRAGRVAQAKENYQRYLELAPNAPDATFIKSMLQ